MDQSHIHMRLTITEIFKYILLISLRSLHWNGNFLRLLKHIINFGTNIVVSKHQMTLTPTICNQMENASLLSYSPFKGLSKSIPSSWTGHFLTFKITFWMCWTLTNTLEHFCPNFSNHFIGQKMTLYCTFNPSNCNTFKNISNDLKVIQFGQWLIHHAIGAQFQNLKCGWET